MAGFTASWVHGNAVVAEKPPIEDGGLFFFNHFGWGTQIRLGPGYYSRWFHIYIPTPVILDGTRMKLKRVFLHCQLVRGANSWSIEDTHLWDGREWIGSRSNGDFIHPSVSIPGPFFGWELPRSREIYFGVGLSFSLAAFKFKDDQVIDNKDAPEFVIGSAGADFEV